MPGESLRQLFDVFIPQFQIREYDELLDIKHDHKFAAVKDLVECLGSKPIDKEFVIQAMRDVLLVKRKVNSFARYVSYAAYGLGFLPGIVGNVIQDAANRIGQRWFEKDIRWQLFFVERAISYDEATVRARLRDDGA
jgi:hypothetical protein